MSTFIGDIVYPNGTYIKDGEEKTRWLKCGAVFENDKGNLRIKLECVPTDMTGGPWFGVFAKDRPQAPAQGQPQAQQQGFRGAPAASAPPAAAPALDDDIPF